MGIIPRLFQSLTFGYFKDLNVSWLDFKYAYVVKIKTAASTVQHNKRILINLTFTLY